MGDYLSNQSIETDISGMYIYAITPDGASATNFSTVRILVANLLNGVQVDLDVLEIRVDDLEAAVVEQQDSSNKDPYLNYTSSFTFTQEFNKFIEHIYIKVNSGTPTVSIGTALGLDDVMREAEITNLYHSSLKDVHPTQNDRTLYVTISGGAVNVSVVVYSKINIF